MSKIKILINAVVTSFFIFATFFFTSLIANAGGVDITVSPFPAFLEGGEDVTITARDVDRGVTYTGYVQVCWRVNHLTVEDCVPFIDSDHITTNLSKQSIGKIRPGSYSYEVVLKEVNGNLKMVAGTEFEVGSVGGLTLSKNSLDFDKVGIGLEAQLGVVVDNSGEVTRIKYTLDNKTDFKVSQTEGSPVNIPAKSKGVTALNVTFKPKSPEGEKTGEIKIVEITNSGDRSLGTVTLKGYGQKIGKEGKISVDPDSLKFGKVEVGKKEIKALKLTNKESVDVTIKNTEFQYTDLTPDGNPCPLGNGEPGPFSSAAVAGKKMAKSGGTLSVDISFSPTVKGCKMANFIVSFLSNGDTDYLPKVIGLKGNEGEAPSDDSPLKVSESSLYFGASKDPKKVTVTNTGASSITVTYELDNNSDFALFPAESKVSAGGSADFTVTYKTPESPGSKSGVINIINKDKPTEGALAAVTLSSDTGPGPGDDNPPGDDDNDEPPKEGGTVSICFPNPLRLGDCDGAEMTFTDVIRNILNGIFGLLGVIAVAMIVYGGFIYMTGGASKDGTEKAKKIITAAIVGLVIVFLALAIVDLLFVLLGGK